MKSVTVLVLVLSLASVFSLELVPFKLREISNASVFDDVGTRIYGGSLASEGQFPYMVYALMKTDKLNALNLCSASLVKEGKVLLAAHCVKFRNLKPEDVILIAGKADMTNYLIARLNMDFYSPIDEGSLGVQERRAGKIHIHHKYNEESLHHDVAVIETKTPFKLEKGVVETIAISQDQMNSVTACTILGWGLTRGNIKSYKLNFVNDRYVSTTKIGCIHKPSGPFICLKPASSGICQGDSGSPLVCNNKVWGVASHFVSDKHNPDCGDSLEEYYSELHGNLDWINPIISGVDRSAVASFSCLLACVVAVIFSGKV